MSILVIGEHDNNELKPSTLNTVTAAQELGDEIDLLIAGADCSAAAEHAARVTGVKRVLKVDDPSLADSLAENLSPLIAKLAGEYTHVLVPASTYGKNIMPRAAALIDVQQISDISGIEGEDTFVRPIYAGNAMATVRSKDAIKMISVRTTAFESATEEGEATIEEIAGAQESGLSKFAGEELTRFLSPCNFFDRRLSFFCC
jgi:electron transfer flavoprotein alpha subunit